MTDAPERIWACVSKNTKSGLVMVLGGATFPVDVWQEYVRADRIEALTAKVKLMDDLDAINVEKIEALEAKLAKAEAGLGKLATAQCFGNGEILGQHLPDTPMGREVLARMNFARATIAEIKGESHDPTT